MQNKIQRGIFLDFEGFTHSADTDMNLLKNLSTKLSTDFRIFSFISIPKDKQTEMEFIKRESPKMFNRSSLMLYAHSRELKRTEMLNELRSGNNIIAFNYCYEKILKSINDDLDINFAKSLFKGLIRPDYVVFYNAKNIENFNFFEYKNYKNFENNDMKKGMLTEYENEIIEIYKSILNKYNINNDNHKKNFFPYSIGEDLFINYPM